MAICMHETIAGIDAWPLTLVPFRFHVPSWIQVFLAAVRPCMQCGGDTFLLMDPLHDVKLTPFRPNVVLILSKHPECWPTAAALEVVNVPTRVRQSKHPTPPEIPT